MLTVFIVAYLYMVNNNEIQFAFGSSLDQYLANGWYRMGQNIFTTNFINYNDTLYKVYWLRYVVNSYKATKTHIQILKKLAHFNVSRKQLVITKELEKLYENYVASVPFEAFGHLEDVLFTKEQMFPMPQVLFNSHQINISHHNQMIASGIFDIGSTSIAGITNFYNPAYKKYSMGKLLSLLKMDFCVQYGLQHYYPGYIVPGIDRFDYKLQMGTACIEVWHSEKKKWLAYHDMLKEIESR